MKKEISLFAVLLGSFCTSFEMSFIWPLTSVYLHDNLHISLALVGLVLFFNSLASVIGNIFGGLGFDKLNPYYLLLLGGGVTTLSLVVLVFFHQALPFSICLFFLGLSAGWNGTLISALGAILKKYDGNYVFNMIYFIQNLGIVIGSSTVGFLYDWNIKLPFIAAMLISFGFLLVVMIGFRALKYENIHGSTHKHSKVVLPKINMYLIYSLFAMLLVTWTMYQQWGSNVSVYITSLGIPFRYYSVLWTINAGLILVIQIFIVRLRHLIKNNYLPIYFGIFTFALSFVVLFFAKQYYLFVVAMVLLTFGEALAFPQVPVIINQLTPNEVKGKYLGLVNSFGSAGRAIAPLIAIIFNLAILVIVYLVRLRVGNNVKNY